MKEMREAALAYYANSSPELQTLAWNFYQALDTDGNGTVTLQEFKMFMQEAGYGSLLQPSFCQELDCNGDGILDFTEVLTFYYMLRCQRLVFCDECRVLLKGMYFTCVQYFHQPSNTYDLCSSCYGNKRFNASQHPQFLDNYALLRCNKLSSASEQVTARTSRSVRGIRTGSKREKMRKAVEAFDILFSIGNTAVNVATYCSIM